MTRSWDVEDLLAFCAIARDRGPWRFDRFGGIRNAKGECPIVGACNAVTPTGHTVWVNAALRKCGVRCRNDVRQSVMRAADLPNDPLRPAMLHALGMEVR